MKAFRPRVAFVYADINMGSVGAMRENIGPVGAMRETTAPRVRSTPPRFGFNRCGLTNSPLIFVAIRAIAKRSMPSHARIGIKTTHVFDTLRNNLTLRLIGSMRRLVCLVIRKPTNGTC
jgi:hypothetical protein